VTPKPVIAGALLALPVSAQPSARQQGVATFRTVADGVVIPVSVTDVNRPVAGLTAADFELTDNGVPQTVVASTVEALPVDVTLLVDTSGSVRGKALDQFRADVQDIADGLHPNDRVRLVTFATSVTDAFGLLPGATRVPTERIKAGGGTGLYDALAATLLALPKGDRLQLVFGFSDGYDNMSLLGPDDVISAARTSGAALYLTIVDQPVRVMRMMTLYSGSANIGALRNAAASTGGAISTVAAGTPLPAAFRRVLDEFRTSYVLSYAPKNVKAEGWHDIVVRVKTGQYTVRTRKGYEG
jgi:VWFA-related protein